MPVVRILSNSYIRALNVFGPILTPIRITAEDYNQLKNQGFDVQVTEEDTQIEVLAPTLDTNDDEDLTPPADPELPDNDGEDLTPPADPELPTPDPTTPDDDNDGEDEVAVYSDEELEAFTNKQLMNLIEGYGLTAAKTKADNLAVIREFYATLS
jgi:hypothetical protein